jgi:hypothetical protein
MQTRRTTAEALPFVIGTTGLPASALRCRRDIPVAKLITESHP